MKINELIWLAQFVEKIERKHDVTTEEVEQLFAHNPRIQRLERGNVKGEDLYRALGETDAGRHLAVFFIYKKEARALVVSAREMTEAEKKPMPNATVRKKHPKRRDPLPEQFENPEEAGNFWDTHDSAEYEEYMQDVEFDVSITRRRFLVPVDSDLYRRVQSIARKKGVSTETLVNMWIQEKSS